MPEAYRDRTQEITLPTLKKRVGSHCAFCGARLDPNKDSREAFRSKHYCDDRCHKAGRKADAAENKKRMRMRMRNPKADPTLREMPQSCYKCGKSEPDVQFKIDRSRRHGKTNICIECEKQKTRDYYLKHKDSIKAKSRNRNAQVRRTKYPEPPPGVHLSGRQMARAIDNLEEIVSVLPSDAPAVLINALDNGKINGHMFEDRGGCGCLWGTLGRAYSWSIAEEGKRAAQFRQRWCAEVDLFGYIKPGDTPETNIYAHIVRAAITVIMRKGCDRSNE